MTTPAFHLQPGAPQTFAPLAALYREGFPEEDLSGLVAALLALPDEVHSTAARDSSGEIIGHVLFTQCAVDGGPARVALLGPLVVAKAWRRRGVGGALIRAGLERMKARGGARACVLGDPGYYGRFGFEVETAITPPYPLPPAWAGAWRSMALTGASAAGALIPPAPWRKRALWTE